MGVLQKSPYHCIVGMTSATIGWLLNNPGMKLSLAENTNTGLVPNTFKIEIHNLITCDL